MSFSHMIIALTSVFWLGNPTPKNFDTPPAEVQADQSIDAKNSWTIDVMYTFWTSNISGSGLSRTGPSFSTHNGYSRVSGGLHATSATSTVVQNQSTMEIRFTRSTSSNSFPLDIEQHISGEGYSTGTVVKAQCLFNIEHNGSYSSNLYNEDYGSSAYFYENDTDQHSITLGISSTLETYQCFTLMVYAKGQ